MIYECNEGNITNKGKAIFKERDYDELDAPYAEKLWSIIGKLMLPECRIPEIDIIKNKNETCVASYIILDRQTEEVFDIRDILYNKIGRKELRENNDCVTVDLLLECLKLQIKDEKNYEKIKKNIIQTIILDCITNNADRHPDNWTLIRNKSTNQYELGLYDHSTSFIDMISRREWVTYERWTSLFIKTEKGENIGKEVIEDIRKKYPEIFDEFMELFNKKIHDFYNIKSQGTNDINFTRIRENIHEKNKYIRIKFYDERYDY